MMVFYVYYQESGEAPFLLGYSWEDILALAWQLPSSLFKLMLICLLCHYFGLYMALASDDPIGCVAISAYI